MAADGIVVTPRLRIPVRELEFHFIHSSGPGGQNVNKVATGVQLRFDAANSPSLPEAVRRRLLELGGQRVTTAGELVITARRFRTQERNRRDAVDRLVALVRQAAARPAPRIKTRVSAAVKRRRLEDKRRQGARKRLRRGAAED